MGLTKPQWRFLDADTMISENQRTIGTGTQAAATGTIFEEAASSSLGEFQDSVAGLLAAVPGDIRRAIDVGQVLGIDNRLAWQVFRIATVKPTLAVGTNVPARVSMKKLLKAAENKGISQEIRERVARAFDSFEHLADTHAGNRASLEVMLNAFIPEEREKSELASRQTIFKGVSEYKGIAAEADLCAMLFHPSPDGRMLDRATLNAEFGLRRSKPDARIVIGIGEALNKPDTSVSTLDGRPINEPLGTLLPQFSTSPLPPFDRQQVDGMAYYFVAGQEVGMRSAVDLVTADRRNAAVHRYLTPGSPRVRGVTHTTDTPVKRLTMDIFLHNDVFPGVLPQLRVHDTATRGWVRVFDDPTRERDRLNVYETVRPLPPGLAGARLAHVPRYVEMLEHLYTTVGWNPADFRAFRFDMQYPMYGAQFTIGFQLPEPPHDAATPVGA